MILRKISLISLLTVISNITVSSCTSAEDNPCGTGYETGIINGNPYIFWMDADYGQLIVEVKDAKGNTETSYQNTIDQYYRNTNGPVQDCSTQTQQNNAVYYL